MKLRLMSTVLLSSCFFTPAFCDEHPDAPERIPIKSIDEATWLMSTVEGPDTLHGDMPGIGKKGDDFLLRVATTNTLNGKFHLGAATATKDGTTHDLFHEIWGLNPATGTLHRWSYDRNGAVFAGPVYRQGDDRVVHVIEGLVIPNDGPLKKTAETLKLSELKYYAEIVFRRVSNEQLGVTVQNVKVGGAPFPWPKLGEETLYTFVD